MPNDVENMTVETEDIAEEDWLRRQLEEKKRESEYLRREMERMGGRIEGLEFALRCNGVSGAEVLR